MNKALCVAVLLLGTVVLTGRHSTATPSGPAYPQIVAKGKLLNQTGELAQTTIFVRRASDPTLKRDAASVDEQIFKRWNGLLRRLSR
jgi:hypothetical protein